MNYYAGIDVSLEASSVCVIDGSGKIVREAKVASEPEALIAWFGSLGLSLTRIGLEAGPLSQWLYAALRDAGLAVELLETRHVRNAFKIMPVKTDRKDAHGIAELMRLGWFRPVHCKSMEAQETRAMLTARKLVQKMLHEVEMSLRGVLRGFGLKVGKTTPVQFEARIKELVAGHQNLEVDRAFAACSACHAAARVQRLRETAACDGARRHASAAFDVDARRRHDRGAHLRIRHRRSLAVQVVESRRGAFRPDADQVSVRGDRPHRPDLQDRRRLGARGALRKRPYHPHQADQGLHGFEELGDADRQAGRHEQSQGGARPQARRHHASDAGRWHDVHDPASVAPCSAPSRTSRLRRWPRGHP
jgi:hypothetical protein